MPMGLVNASYTFQKMMQIVLSGLQWQICMAYLDDVIVYSKSFDKHLENLNAVFDRFRNEGLKLRPKKCHFCKPEVLYLGHIVGKDGIRPNPDKIEVIRTYPLPVNCNEVRSFVALVSYYRRFIKGFASIASPLNNLLKKAVKFEWNQECQAAFECLRDSLTSAPVLSYPNFQERFSLYTDASNTGLGAILAQNINGEEKTNAFASRSLKVHERKYAAIERECLAIVWGVVTLNTGNKTFKLGLISSFILNRPFPFLPSHPTSGHHLTSSLSSHLTGHSFAFVYLTCPFHLLGPLPSFYIYLVMIRQLNLCIYVCKIILNNQSVDQYLNSTSSISGSVFSAR